jgi:hypothetical protein
MSMPTGVNPKYIILNFLISEMRTRQVTEVEEQERQELDIIIVLRKVFSVCSCFLQSFCPIKHCDSYIKPAV